MTAAADPVLKPCPFCGASEACKLKRSSDVRPVRYWLYCTQCGAHGPLAESVEDAVSDWDRRATTGGREVGVMGLQVDMPRCEHGAQRGLCVACEKEEREVFIEIPKSHLFSPAEAAARELWARRFITEITGVARGLGYGMFHGGSLIRDIDIVAVPWRHGDKFLTHLDFVLELIHCLPLRMGNHGATIFGHSWYAIWHKDHRDHQIDLKVILPAVPTRHPASERA